MLEVQAETLGTVTIVHFKGRILIGNATRTLREAVLAQEGANILVLDFAHVDLVDAGGLGTLLELREWTQSKEIEFKLMNLISRVQHLFEITCLDCVFEITSEDMMLTATTGPTPVIPTGSVASKFSRHSVASLI